MKQCKTWKRLLSVLLAVCLLFSLAVTCWADETDGAEPELAGDDLAAGVEQPQTDAPARKAEMPSYQSYFAEHEGEVRPTTPVEAGVAQVTAVADEAIAHTTQDAREAVLINSSNKWAEWTVDVPETGIYNLALDYYPVADSGRQISFSLMIDGVQPYTEAGTLSVSRIWVDKGNEDGNCQRDKIFSKDETGNDIRPSQVERPRWNTQELSDPLGTYADPYFFYLEAGTHTVRMTRVREAMAVGGFALKNKEELPSYASYLSAYTGKETTGEVIQLEAEIPYEKTDSTLYALTDHQSAGTTPTHPTNMMMNTIGDTNWAAPGQALTWKVHVPQPGLYKIALRARQNQNPGMYSYRTLSVNGKTPFAEAENLGFFYSTSWQVTTLGNEDGDFLIYLEDGDKLTMTVCPGLTCNVQRDVQNAVLDLNELYRKIIVITGTTPDVYQDYYLEDEIPGLKETLVSQSENLTRISDDILAVTGKTNSQTSILLQAADRLLTYSTKSYEITANLSAFKSSIESLSSMLLTLGSQPLGVDCFYLVPADAKAPSGNVGLWQTVKYSVLKFIGSFTTDYQIEGGKETIEVWVSTGRDQMQIVSSLISEFTAQTGIRVRLSLVDTGDTLIKATMAGKGPDIALMVGSDYTINLAMRGALVNLEADGYKIFDTCGDRFSEAAWKHFRYNGGIYGIPETQTWPMIFYRTDIFEELDLEVPDTWTELYEVLRTLQGQNMNIGMTETSSATPGVSGSIDIFQSILFQKGGTYYNDSLTATLFDTQEAYEAFEQWADFYGKYGVARSVDFYNRLRTGDVPIGVSTYGTYNQLMAAAPELRGLWAMDLMPGTKKEDGTIDRSVASGGTGSMLLTSAQKRGVADDAYKFLLWWTSDEIQLRYGLELEASMGVAARYAPASINAFHKIGWTDDEMAILEQQRVWTKNVFSIPGNYMVSRSLTNAVRSVLDNNTEPRRTLSKYNRDINAEITRKRKEFHLD